MNNVKRTALLGLSCLSALLTVTQAQAEPTLYLGMNGGTMERLYADKVLPVFEKANNVKVVIVPGTSADILAKVQASKGNPQMHVMFLDDGIMYRAIAMGLCDKLEDSPTLAQIPAKGRIKDQAVAVSLGVTGLAYNTRLFKEKGWATPTSWMDMADPRFKDKLVFQSMASSTFGLHGFLMFNRIQGGSETDVEPGFKAWPNTVGRNVLEYIPSSAKISEMLQTDEAALFPLTPTQVTALKLKGMPVEYAQPKEGAVVLNVAECAIANNTQPELAQKLAAFLLTPEAQAAALEDGDQIPSNPNTPTTDKTRGQVEAMKQYLTTAIAIDWDQVNEQRPAWNARWNRSIER
ncbi:ABC-type Fe3+ transport system, periplasmic component [Pseudomonas sp. IT-P44]|jgi:putative spermidine/putrescine transport system substrate-binding protein|uniref:Polyamine ABC transporter substrate-binding protein n=1 Tax=Pseudomonas migulae TaxID=78543 RepID=A0ABY8MRT0_9PSED|nr:MULTISPECIES: ABC transporter substrate-binding protein [Pseudomonas]EJM81947.1 ABC-type Fe3+ transport system, periplasmic component [Pseudomonas sp. GM60]EJM87783.1 ABC-type Fe3+ transport system, periplasmic component [Pseudomonas sp. GM67]MBD9549176.1 polyamine ABC transporter substrate-binding protein [Pseudomonas sp. PDM01]MBD9615156.1 polyamine ABC transporter substrate-binding protein [Pseudomonas sp. PDM02]UCP12115.1 polyamine ABC transporter substrate-binding protein [Pseudomonas 